MAITYNYSYNIVGDAHGAVTNTASTSAALTGLTLDANYEVRVQSVDDQSGVIYYSSYDEVTFTSSAQPVSINLAAITHSSSLNPVELNNTPTVFLGTVTPTLTLEATTPVVIFTGPTYTLRVNHIEGTISYIDGIVTNSYNLTGLIQNDNYEVSVRPTDRSGTVEYPQVYSAVLAFASDALPWVDLGSITPNVILNELAVSLVEPVQINLGSLNLTPTYNAVVAYTPTIVTVDLGLIPLAPAPGSIQAFLASLTAYNLKVVHEGGDTTFYNNITSGTYNLTGLIPNETYTVGVEPVNKELDHNGVTYFVIYNHSLTFVSELRNEVNVELGTALSTTTLTPLTVWDRILQIVNFAYDNNGEDFTVTGEGLPNIQEMTITVDGLPMVVALDGTLFTGTLEQIPLLINSMEELDGNQTLYAGTTLIEVR